MPGRGFACGRGGRFRDGRKYQHNEHDQYQMPVNTTQHSENNHPQSPNTATPTPPQPGTSSQTEQLEPTQSLESSKIITWNVNGWTYQNQILRCEIIKNINPDIACINEAHLKDLDIIKLTGYTWFGFNRPARHKCTQSSGWDRCFC